MGAGGQREAGPGAPAGGAGAGGARRRSGRVAKIEAEERAVALAATKEYFAEMGRELMAQEDAEGEARFAAEVEAEEARQGRACILLDPVADSEDEEEDESEEESEEEAAPEGAAALLAEEGTEDGDGDDSEDEDWEMPESRYEVLSKAPRAYVPEAAAEAFEAITGDMGDGFMRDVEGEGDVGEAVRKVWAVAGRALVVAELKKKEGAPREVFAQAFGATMALSTLEEEFGLFREELRTPLVAAVLKRLANLWGFLKASSAAELDMESESLEAILGKLGRVREAWGEKYGVEFPVGGEAGEPAGKRARVA